MRNISKRIFFTLLAIIFYVNIYSQDKDDIWVIGFGVNVVDFYPANLSSMKTENGASTKWFDNFFKIDNYNYISAPSKLSLSRYLNKSFNVEVAVSVNKITNMGSLNVPKSRSYISVDTNFNYNLNTLIGESSWFDPYAVMGGGAHILLSDKSLTFNFGGGTKLWFGKKAGVRLQSVYKHTIRGSFSHFQHSIGVFYKFGSKDEDNDGVYDKNDECSKKFGLAEFNGCPDSDKDGIQDSADACPNVFGSLNTNGCPDTDGDGVEDVKDKCPYVKGEIKDNGCPNADGDGLIDLLDACPKVAGPVENKGCPWPDTDGDGVSDLYDECVYEVGPKTNKGCPVITKVELAKLDELFRTVYFDSGRSTFTKETFSRLDEIAQIMIKNSTAKFSILGHTDNTGNNIINQTLSNSRANAVKEYLVSKGVSINNLTAKGFGEDMPIATNETSYGRSQNRRVEVKLIN